MHSLRLTTAKFFQIFTQGLLLAGILFFAFTLTADAQTTNIFETESFAQFETLDANNDGEGDLINWRPDGQENVIIDEGPISGFIWGESVGWINLAPDPTIMDPTALAQVGGPDAIGLSLTCTNPTGDFSGYIWGETAGWINMSPDQGGVTLLADGAFDGHAWSENFGWIEFSCPGDACVRTTFSCDPQVNIIAPPTINTQSTTNTTPIISGTWDHINATTLSVTIDGNTFLLGTDPELSTDGAGNWSLDMANSSLSPGVYTVTAETSDGTTTVTDNTTQEITISSTPPPSSGGGGGGAPTGLCTLDATPAVIQVGNSTTLSWASSNITQSNFTSGSIQPGNISISSSSGTAIAQPQTTTEYTLTMQGQGVDPAMCNVDVLVDQVVVPNDQDSFVGFENTTYTLQSGALFIPVRINRVGDLGENISVRVQSENGTAFAGAHYTSVDTILQWGAGDNAPKIVFVNINPANLSASQDLWLKMTLSDPTNTTLFNTLTLLTLPRISDAEITDPTDTPPESSDPTVEPVDPGEIDDRYGCLDPQAQNYNPQATISDSAQCEYIDGVIFGCIDPDARNFNPNADQGNGSCVYEEPIIVPSDDGAAGIIGRLRSDPVLPMPVLQILAVLAAISSLPGVLSRMSNILLSFIGLWKKNKPWGTVYDARTKQPLDPAYVQLFDAKNEEVAGVITDADGRFGFLADPGRYRIEAQKTHYHFPSQIMNGKHKDELYNNLYFGEWFDVQEHGQVIVKNIPLDPEGHDWNEQEKLSMGKGIFVFFSKYDRLIVKIVNVFFAIGFLFAIYAMIISPVLINGIVLGLYIVLSILFIFGFAPTHSGRITYKDGTPVSFAIVRIFNTHLQKEVAHKVTDAHGHYFMLTHTAEYYITIEEKRGDDTYEKIFTSPSFKAKRGIINKSFTV